MESSGLLILSSIAPRSRGAVRTIATLLRALDVAPTLRA
jgi:hypothetical protein